MWPETRSQGRGHKLVNALDEPPQRPQPRAECALHDTMYTATRSEREAAKTVSRPSIRRNTTRRRSRWPPHRERLTAFLIPCPALEGAAYHHFDRINGCHRAPAGAGSRPLIPSSAFDQNASLSANGKWIISTSEGTGRTDSASRMPQPLWDTRTSEDGHRLETHIGWLAYDTD